jgi:hypothetical protein
MLYKNFHDAKNDFINKRIARKPGQNAPVLFVYESMELKTCENAIRVSKNVEELLSMFLSINLSCHKHCAFTKPK